MKESVLSELKSINNLIKRLVIANFANHSELSSLSAQQMHVIIFIMHAQKHNLDVYQRDIEKSFNIRPSTVTGIIRLLVKKGYIIKQSVPNDARLKKLVLTEKSNSIRENFEPFIKATEKIVLEGISEEELNQFLNVIHKMKENLIKSTKNQDNNRRSSDEHY